MVTSRSSCTHVATSLLAIATIALVHEGEVHAAPVVYFSESLGFSAVKVTTPARSDQATTWHAALAFRVFVSPFLDLGLGASYDAAGLLTRSSGVKRNIQMRVVDPTLHARLYPACNGPIFVEAELGGRFVSLPDPAENVRGFLFATTIGVERFWARRRSFGTLFRMAYVPALSGGGTSTTYTLAFFISIGG